MGGLEAIQGETAFVSIVCYICSLIESLQCFPIEERGTQSDYIIYSRSQLFDDGRQGDMGLNSSVPHSNSMAAVLHHKGQTVALRNAGPLGAPQPQLILAWEKILFYTLQKSWGAILLYVSCFI